MKAEEKTDGRLNQASWLLGLKPIALYMRLVAWVAGRMRW